MEYKNDLKKRVIEYGKIILLICSEAKGWSDRIICKQLLRSGTSVGANYMEADGTESSKDFKHKLTIVRKELKESCYWLEILIANNFKSKDLKKAIQETDELTRIFSSIIRKITEKC